jgi:hypothetical protein
MKRRMLVAAATLAALGAHAAAAPRYVAMSLVGDEITYSGAPETSTGTLHPRGKSQAVPMKGAPFDRTVLEVLAGAVPRAHPGATLSFLASSAPEAFTDQESWFYGDKVKLPPAVRGAIDKEGASQLLLVTKIRGEAGVSDGSTKFGFGKLSGLGFYVDGHTDMVDPKLGPVHGFIAPYVYVKLSVIDLATSTVTAHRVVQSASPYTSLTGQAMMDTLQDILVKSMSEAVEQTLK